MFKKNNIFLLGLVKDYYEAAQYNFNALLFEIFSKTQTHTHIQLF